MLQLQQDGTFHSTMPYKETKPIPPDIPSSRGYVRSRTIGRAVGKRGTSPVNVSGELLGKMTTTIPKPPEIPYVISSTGPYNTEEKIILRVTIRGYDNTEHHTTAMIDCGATENVID
jgi:hypothetical protein